LFFFDKKFAKIFYGKTWRDRKIFKEKFGVTKKILKGKFDEKKLKESFTK